MDLTSTGKQMRKRSGLDFNWRTHTNMKTTKYQYEDYQLAYVGNFQILTFDYLGKTFHRFWQYEFELTHADQRHYVTVGSE